VGQTSRLDDREADRRRVPNERINWRPVLFAVVKVKRSGLLSGSTMLRPLYGTAHFSECPTRWAQSRPCRRLTVGDVDACAVVVFWGPS